MQYAKVKGTQVLKYPYTVFDLTTENNTNYGLVDDLPAVFAATDVAASEGSKLVEVSPAPVPPVDEDTQVAVEVTPIQVAGVWTQSWAVQDRPLAECVAARQTRLTGQYQAQSQRPVAFTTAAGVAQVFQADLNSQQLLQSSLAGLSGAGATPPGFFWVTVDNTHVAFTFADVQGLAAAMLMQGWQAFQKLQMLKTELRAATAPAMVRSIVW